MRKNIIYTAGLLFLAWLFLFSGCGKEVANKPELGSSEQNSSINEPAGKKPIIMKIGTQSAESSCEVKVLEYFEQLVEKKSDGAIDIRIYPDSKLGTLQELMQGVSLGTIEMATVGMDAYMNYYQDFAVFNMWMFSGPEDFIRLYQSPIGDQLKEVLQEQSGIRILSYNLCGTGKLYFWGNKSIETVGDFSGLKVRSNSSYTNPVAIESFGAVPIQVAWTDMQTALQAGVIDIACGDVENILASGYDSSLTYRYDGPENFLASSICISEKVWSSLPSELCTLLEETLVEACQTYGNGLYVNRFIETETRLAESGVITLPMQDGEKAAMASLIRTAILDYLYNIVSPETLQEMKEILEI